MNKEEIEILQDMMMEQAFNDIDKIMDSDASEFYHNYQDNVTNRVDKALKMATICESFLACRERESRMERYIKKYLPCTCIDKDEVICLTCAILAPKE
jgi:hypothetical protein